MPIIWDTSDGRRSLREIESGQTSLASVAKRLELPEWEAHLIAKLLRWRRRHRKQGQSGLSAVAWARSVARELDILHVEEARRQFAVAHFDKKGFRGKREHLDLLLASIGNPTEDSPWNRWRRRDPGMRPDLRGARLTGLDLRGLRLHDVWLEGGDLSGSQLRLCNLNFADLRGVQMRHTDLSYASLVHAKLNKAVIIESLLVDADLGSADLRKAVLIGCLLNRARLCDAKLRDAIVWGVGAWDISTSPEKHSCLVVVGGDLDPADFSVSQLRRKGQSLRVDNIEMAHFVELIADNEKIGAVLSAAARRLVLLLGRFQGEHAGILKALRRELPNHKYAPVVFDFTQDPSRDLVETITTLAGLSAFVIADLSDPRSTPFESHAIVPNIAIPFVPIIQGEEPFAMFSSLQSKYFWVLPTFTYRSEADLIGSLKEKVIDPAEKMMRRLRALKTRRP